MALKIRLEADVREKALVSAVRRAAVHPLVEMGVEQADIDRVSLIVSEACRNAVKYAYPDGGGSQSTDGGRRTY